MRNRKKAAWVENVISKASQKGLTSSAGYTVTEDDLVNNFVFYAQSTIAVISGQKMVI